MREILFRGKRKDNSGEAFRRSDKEWVYGYIFQSWEQAYILWGTINSIPTMIEVIPETVGEYTTKNDPNGKKIFEGDIVTEGGLVAEVRWDDRNARFYYVTSTASVGLYGFVGQVIGDIHTTPELLKEKP